MKIICQFGLLIFLLFSCQLEAQVHVKQDAIGSNDGSSWENAFNDLSVAINSSAKGDEIWVAEGVYLPGQGTPNRESFFSPPHDLKLYGGFSGTETSLSERDVMANPTTLSGDVLGDDLPGDFINKRTDNCRHVMWLTDTITTESTFDGFIIEGGHTDPSTSSGDDRRGGGILCYGAPSIRNCVFRENFGHFGGGLYPRGGTASGVLIENCEFRENMGGFGAGLYINATEGNVNNCSFINNRVTTSGGGAYCGSRLGITFNSCRFEKNTNMDRGGGLYIFSSPSKLNNCIFSENVSTTLTGGAIHIRTTTDDPASIVEISNCEFKDGLATWGGAVSAYGDRTEAIFESCSFEGNSAVNNGGAIHNGRKADTYLNNCEFRSNNANRGGAINNQDDSTSITIENCSFLQNNAASVGGAITMTTDEVQTDGTPLLSIKNSVFEGHISATQAGAIDFSNCNGYIESTLIATNFVSEEGAGGGISFNASDTFSIQLDLVNVTLADNSSSIGAGVAGFTDESSTAIINFQNTILQNQAGSNYEIEDGTPTIQSNGGNLSSDNSFGGQLNGTNDLENVDPIFVNPAGGNFELSDQSPAVNSGVTSNAPTTDILGRGRVGNIDMGAYENQNVTSVGDENKSFGELILIRDNEFLIIQFVDEYMGRLKWSLIDMNGKVVESGDWLKHSSQLDRSIGLNKVSDGTYIFRISNGAFQNSRQFIK